MTRRKVWIGGDWSVNSTGMAVLDEHGHIIEGAILTPDKYPGYSTERYPKSTLKKARNVSDKIVSFIREAMKNYDVQKIIIEEINPKGGSTMAVKSLSIVHGMVMWDCLDIIHLFEMMTVGIWRSKAGVGVVVRKRKGKKGTSEGNEHKQPIVDYVNNKYGTHFTLDDNDLCDAISITLAYLYINKILKKY